MKYFIATEKVERIERDSMNKRSTQRELVQVRPAIELNNLKYNEIFQSKEAQIFLQAYTAEHGKVGLWNEHKVKHHYEMERQIEILFKVLNQIGYFADEERQYRSGIHDISHAVYATASDFFVIEDKKLRQKCKAVYNYYEVPTQVLSYSEFNELNNL
jgi:hypothetical protein